jgi:hypothetical protein
MDVLCQLSMAMDLLRDKDIPRRIFLDVTACEFVNHGASSRVHFMEQKSNSASSFGNDVSHHR